MISRFSCRSQHLPNAIQLRSPVRRFHSLEPAGSVGCHREISAGEVSAPVMVFGHRRWMSEPRSRDRGQMDWHRTRSRERGLKNRAR
jgi:hypothetical protein